MELLDLYDKIQNPIDDIEVIEKLIVAYANSKRSYGGFYTQLTKIEKKEHINEYFTVDSDKFYSMMFNKWKNSIVSMTKEEFVKLYEEGSYEKDFITMRKHLKNINDVSSAKEANAIFFPSKEEKELKDALEKYRWTSFGSGTGWMHVCSRYVTAKKDKYPNIEHRLYIDTESMDTYKMATHIVEKCNKKKIPYYFKFDECGDRDDTIVIYSSTENLAKYIDILYEIKKEHPNLVSRVKKPPLLTGKIDNWIGYGSQPSRLPDGRIYSFNEIRSKVIASSISEATKNWILDHKEQKVMYQGKIMTFEEYVTLRSVEDSVKDSDQIIREVLLHILKFDTSLILYIQHQIKENSSKYGIDKEKFCFDKSIKEKMIVSSKDKSIEEIPQIIRI